MTFYRQTIHDPIPFPKKKLSKFSPEVVLLLKGKFNFFNILAMLNKDPKKRPDIKTVLEDSWITKYNKSSLPEKRRKSKELSLSNFEIYSSTDDKKSIKN